MEDWLETPAGAEGTFERGDDGRFTGDVRLRGSISDPDGTNPAIVRFAPGAWTHWHRYPCGAPGWAEPVTDGGFGEGFSRAAVFGTLQACEAR